MSRNAIKGSDPINNGIAVKLAAGIIDNINIFFNNNVKTCTLGSTGKKPDNGESGDIDIAIELQYNKENISKVFLFLHEFYPSAPIYVCTGFKIISFGLNYFDGTCYKLAQVDLMFSSDINYSKFMYHSPNYKNNESDFKGLYRTNLLIIMAGRVPTGIKDIYNENNELTDYWKYSLSYDEGLKLVHKSYKGKRGLLKNPSTIKEDTKQITKDITEIIEFILGDNAGISDTNSFESLISFMFSDEYKYKDNPNIIDNILEDFLTDERHLSKVNELTNFINDTKVIYEIINNTQK